MFSKRRLVIWVPVVLVAVTIVAAFVLVKSHQPAPANADAAALPQSGGHHYNRPDSDVGYGWSFAGDTAAATEEAVKATGCQDSDLTIAVWTCAHDSQKILQTIRRLQPKTQIWGLTSDYGCVLPDGYHHNASGTVGLLSMKLPGMTVGVGGAAFDEVASTPQIARLAWQRALANSHMSATAKPRMILFSANFAKIEEPLIAELDKITGGIPIAGGTSTNQSNPRGPAKGSVIGGDKVYGQGLTLCLIFSDQPVKWTFRGGFDRTSKSGVITNAESRVIHTIDGRPAAQVYNEWTDGKMGEVMDRGEDIRKWTGLYPICRQLTRNGQTHTLFQHVYPMDDWKTSGNLGVSSNVSTGDHIDFAEGTWNILMNRLGKLPEIAGFGKDDVKTGAAFLICCESVLKNVPVPERTRIADMMDEQMGEDTPWIGAFTWGEDGNFPGVGNYHGNTLTSLTLIPRSK